MSFTVWLLPDMPCEPFSSPKVSKVFVFHQLLTVFCVKITIYLSSSDSVLVLPDLDHSIIYLSTSDKAVYDFHWNFHTPNIILYTYIFPDVSYCDLHPDISECVGLYIHLVFCLIIWWGVSLRVYHAQYQLAPKTVYFWYWSW